MSIFSLIIYKNPKVKDPVAVLQWPDIQDLFKLKARIKEINEMLPKKPHSYDEILVPLAHYTNKHKGCFYLPFDATLFQEETGLQAKLTGNFANDLRLAISPDSIEQALEMEDTFTLNYYTDYESYTLDGLLRPLEDLPENINGQIGSLNINPHIKKGHIEELLNGLAQYQYIIINQTLYTRP